MKKILLVTFAAMMLASVSFSLPFSPQPLELSVDPTVEYEFDGSDVDFRVGVSGKPARVYLWINTRLGADKPVDLRNGYLGWHYVNNIDTTVYVSGSNDLPIGQNNIITWDGNGSENTSKAYGGTFEPTAAVESGKYDYYVWGYDVDNNRELVCNFIAMNFYWRPQFTKIMEFHDDGSPRTQPKLVGNTHVYNNYKQMGPAQFTAFKFLIGSDPDNYQDLETSFMPGFSNTEGMLLFAGAIVFHPQDESVFFATHEKTELGSANVYKWDFVDGGTALIDEGWGGEDLLLETDNEKNDGYLMGTGTDGQYFFAVSPGTNSADKWDKFYIVNFDGEEVAGVQIDAFYDPDAPTEAGMNGRLNRLYANPAMKGQAAIGGEKHCMLMIIDTDRMADGDSDYIKWTNGNGDFFNDAGWGSDTPADQLWNCNHMEKVPNSGRRDEQHFDRNSVVIQHPDYAYAWSWVTYTQDGTGVAYCKLADDQVAQLDENANKKGSGQRVDTGSSYDGIYLGQAVNEDVGMYGDDQSTNWIAADSAKGLLTFPDSVEEAGQAAFSVSAAYPNPANPTTTIGFTLAEAGHVSVDIYNVAGQKVDTLVNSEMSMGSHSIVWDASQFSAGVYFYTVSSGSFSKTMKVTLLK